MKLTATQRRVLLDRLNAVRFNAPADERDPPEVKAARALVQAFDRKQQKAKAAAYTAWRGSLVRIKEQIHFDTDAAKALAAVHEFENRK